MCTIFSDMKEKLKTKVKNLNWRKLAIWGTVAALAFLILLPIATYAYYYRDIGDKERLMNRNESGLTLSDRNGEVFFVFYQPKNKDLISLENIPEHMQQAVISSEDKEFYSHSGFSIRGIIRAALTNLRAGSIKQGGSTITQELIKNNLLTPKRSFIRKYQEVVLAVAVNNRYSKEEILEMYLNSVYFGEGAFGVENAAQTYFGVPASELDLAQSTMLAGILPAPSVYSPLSNDAKISEDRKNMVLNEMAKDGVINEEVLKSSVEETLKFNPKREDVNAIAPHFALMVKDQLIAEYGEEYVIRSGLQVKTTLNTDWQKFAEQTLKQQVANLVGRDASNAAAVAIDPKTGEILVLVGSHDWHNQTNGKINMAISPRQPGSAFKPLIYAEAFERKLITPATILEDTKKTFQGNYEPTNYDNQFRGPVSVRRSLANSLNVPAVEVMNTLGVRNGLSTAQDFGITTLGKDASHYGLSLVLGSGEVKLTELTNAYAVFANQGVRNDLNSILEVKNKYGEIIMTKVNNDQRVISSESAFLISSILSDIQARAETFGNSLNIGRTVAVKTGTTQDYRDSLTVGYTPSLVVGVWVGNNDNTPMSRVAGSSGAAPIWRLLMQNFLSGRPDESFSQPNTIVRSEVCITLTDGENSTPSAIMEYFIRGTAENQDCQIPSPTPEEENDNEDDDEEGNENQEENEEEDEGDKEEPEPTSTPEPTATPEPSATPSPIITIPLPTEPEED